MIFFIQSGVSASATLLFYNSLVPGGQPDQTLVFHQVIANSHQLAVVGGTEQDVFSYQTVTPEPAMAGVPLAGVVLHAGCSRRRNRASKLTTELS